MQKILSLFMGLLLLPSTSYSLTGKAAGTNVKDMTTGDMLNWSIGMFIVLCIFFVLIWLMKKLNSGTVTGSGQLQVIGGLSLSMREKIVILKAGNKQLILGVSPGHIETLHVLEGEDCLATESGSQSSGKENLFANKLMQVMQGKNNV